MKQLLYIIIGMVLLVSCDVETSDNGDLDGFWQMTEMSGEDMRSSGITWAFQGDILELRDVNKVHQDIIMSFEHQGNQLVVSQPYLVDREQGDVALQDAELLEPYGILGVTSRFEVLSLTSNKLLLQSVDAQSGIRLSFRKY